MFLKKTYIQLSHSTWDKAFIASLLLFETALSIIIITKVPYTEIDWIAYNEEVDTWKNGELDYMNIRGGTGPLVYPAGFLYLYRFIQWLAGGDGSDIFTAQKIFVGLYVFHAWVVLSLYSIVMRQNATAMEQGLAKKKDDIAKEDTKHNIKVSHLVWSWRISMILCCLSKRMHSIFMLRLFNDAPTMLLLYISVYFFIKSHWKIGCVFFSLGVSIKMNVLLFAPGLLLLLLQAMETHYETIQCLAICAIIQLVLGAPFLLTYPVSYLKKAFEFDRVFFYKWTVNWKFLPEEIFISKNLSLILLSLHLSFLAGFAWKWLKSSKKQTGYYIHIPMITSHEKRILSPQYIMCTMFISNYIGICFSRTLHYQFYSWYYHTVPFLLWSTSISIPLRFTIVLGIEIAFNVFPATAWSSMMLQIAHFVLLGYLVFMEVPPLFLTIEKQIVRNEIPQRKEKAKQPQIVMF